MADANRITRLLLKKYPDSKTTLNFTNPLEILVATILSAQCTDVKVNEVTKGLFKKYKTLRDYAGADIREFEGDIREINYYRNKARMITDCSARLIKDFRGNIPQTIEELITLPGVGRKTANVVLGIAFGKQTIPVDTHVLRISNRLGLAQSGNPGRVERELMDQIQYCIWTTFSFALILHGRETCRARNPKCKMCILYQECEWTEKRAR